MFILEDSGLNWTSTSMSCWEEDGDGVFVVAIGSVGSIGGAGSGSGGIVEFRLSSCKYLEVIDTWSSSSGLVGPKAILLFGSIFMDSSKSQTSLIVFRGTLELPVYIKSTTAVTRSIGWSGRRITVSCGCRPLYNNI